jgi:hypothetical protein
MIDDIIGHNKPLQHLPIGSMKIFGTNPYDEALYRVIWSESRYVMSGGKHHVYEGKPSNDDVVNARGKDPNQLREEIGYKWVPLYPGIHAWVLERWMSAISFTGMTPEMWAFNYRDPATGLMELGPYPSRGDYKDSFIFPAEPGWSAVATAISWAETGRTFTFEEHKQATLNDLAMKQKDWSNNYEARAIDARPVGGIRPCNLRPGKKSPERRINFKKAAEEVGIRPQHRGVSVGEPILRS